MRILKYLVEYSKHSTCLHQQVVPLHTLASHLTPFFYTELKPSKRRPEGGKIFGGFIKVGTEIQKVALELMYYCSPTLSSQFQIALVGCARHVEKETWVYILELIEHMMESGKIGSVEVGKMVVSLIVVTSNAPKLHFQTDPHISSYLARSIAFAERISPGFFNALLPQLVALLNHKSVELREISFQIVNWLFRTCKFLELQSVTPLLGVVLVRHFFKCCAENWKSRTLENRVNPTAKTPSPAKNDANNNESIKVDQMEVAINSFITSDASFLKYFFTLLILFIEDKLPPEVKELVTQELDNTPKLIAVLFVLEDLTDNTLFHNTLRQKEVEDQVSSLVNAISQLSIHPTVATEGEMEIIEQCKKKVLFSLSLLGHSPHSSIFT
eukprot:CAMPEP_0174271180 /NCGR_PEP_ID=MMETSP0439-20130205/47013_1 /TAXON_ID=0 /ORGANISM="Stereomyxa ramosa, Strain Chinc5" /LENGTH=383 /DNA_ID=CAMNT_0015361013 /DNA_START=1479 /DNA_END=2630 /DNA_ORIENTATION=+